MVGAGGIREKNEPYSGESAPKSTGDQEVRPQTLDGGIFEPRRLGQRLDTRRRTKL